MSVSDTKKNHAIDGLRGIAALGVIIHHFICAFWPAVMYKNHPDTFSVDPAPSIMTILFSSPLTTLFYNGRFAVVIFFVISGYVLTIPYYRNNLQALKERLIGRYLRLTLPIIAATILSFVLLVNGVYFNHDAAPLSGSDNWLALHPALDLNEHDAINTAFKSTLTDIDRSLIPPLWTLKIEFFGSVYLLLLYILIPRRFNKLAMLVACIAIFKLYSKDSIYFYAIFAGSYLNAFKLENMWHIPALILGCYFGAYQYDSNLYSFLPQMVVGNNELWPVKEFYNVVGALLITASIIGGCGRKILVSKPAQFLGRTSYSVYLLHFLILCSLSCWLYIQNPISSLWLFANFAIFIVVCYAASGIFERTIDRPSIVFSHAFTKKLLSMWRHTGKI